MATSARAGRLIGQFWVYTLLRIALFAAVWGVLWLVNVRGLLGLLLAVLLSVPLSFVLLARPRAALAASLEQRVAERKEREDDLRQRLAGTAGTVGTAGDAGAADSAGGGGPAAPPSREAGPKRKDRRS
jgi:membrane protein implicated in regulation of membrane protease activity